VTRPVLYSASDTKPNRHLEIEMIEKIARAAVLLATCIAFPQQLALAQLLPPIPPLPLPGGG